MMLLSQLLHTSPHMTLQWILFSYMEPELLLWIIFQSQAIPMWWIYELLHILLSSSPKPCAYHFHFLPGASLSGWRWGKCARCATCLSCSSPSRLAARTPLCQYSSLCPGSRTWCRMNQTLSYSYYSHTSYHPYSHLYQVHFGMSRWTDRRNWSYCADSHRNCESAPLLFLHCFTKRISWYQF